MIPFVLLSLQVFAAFIPPVEWRGGYPALGVALGILGMLMAIVKEVAHMFGCALGLSDLMTGMSIVALGTSLPDTFASQYAAIHDDSAVSSSGCIELCHSR